MYEFSVAIFIKFLSYQSFDKKRLLLLWMLIQTGKTMAKDYWRMIFTPNKQTLQREKLLMKTLIASKYCPNLFLILF